MTKLNEEVLRDFQVRTEIDGEFEVMESDELGVDEAYDNELIKELGLDEDSSVFSYAIAEKNDEENMYTLEYSHEGVLLTIHDYDEEYVPQAIYKNVI
ncbi:hypothetical protein PALS2_122 [Staphylococcus phage PALS_2]|nr:hypothetical protein PALS2_122 [Staphylococcus phage PALS_2]